MTSQPGSQKITIHIAQYLTKQRQQNKFGQLIEYNNKNIFLQNHVENEAGRLVSDHFLFF